MITSSKVIVRNVVKIAIGFVFGVSVMSSASAQVPKPDNPLNIVGLPFDQRLAKIKARNAMLVKLTPQDRQAYFQQRSKMMADMSPADKQAISDQAKANQAVMTPAQKAEIKAEHEAFIKALPADERPNFQVN